MGLIFLKAYVKNPCAVTTHIKFESILTNILNYIKLSKSKKTVNAQSREEVSNFLASNLPLYGCH